MRVFRASISKMAYGGKAKAETNLEVTNQQKTEIKEAFSLFDTKCSGFMDSKDLTLAMRALGFEPRKDELNDLRKQFGNGKISMEDFSVLVRMHSIVIP